MAVRVRPGVVEATLGDVAGVVGVARRAFEVGGVEYVDVDLSAETIEQFPVERRNSFYDRKIVFTRLRLPRTSVEPEEASSSNPIDLPLFYRRRAEIQRVVSGEWYHRVGNVEQDPTAEAADVAGRVSRRRAMLIAAGVGVVVVGVAAYAVSSCQQDESRNGSWGRSGGGYGGYHGGGFGS
ncbi:MAG: hypothetical protein WBY94_16270 [Polyangiaceae bacterium]